MEKRTTGSYFMTLRNILAVAAVLLCLSVLVFAEEKETGPLDFSFVQMSDTHWGFDNPAVTPDSTGTLKLAIAGVNRLKPQPDFVIFTGDLTHTTDDPKERRKRLSEFRDIARGLNVKDVRFMPGEHDAGLDHGEAYKEFFGETRYSFTHKGVHFIAVDNVSDPASSLGGEQLAWLGDELKKLDKNDRIVIFSHRPLFDLYPEWDWWTRDGAKALELLKPYKNVTVFYGHIHQENHHMEGDIAFHAAKGLMYPLPAAGSVPKKAPIPWDAAKPYGGLGYRSVLAEAGTGKLILTEYPVVPSGNEPPAAEQAEQVIKITAKQFEFIPNEIRIKKGVPVILELTSLDVVHGFNVPGLGVRADVMKGTVTRVRILAEKKGNYKFYCDIFCGSGHDDMTGKIIVED